MGCGCPFFVLGGQGGADFERVEHGQALEVGHGRGKQGLQPGFSSAPETGFAHTEVLEVIDPAFHFRPAPQEGFGLGVTLGGSGCFDAVVVDNGSYSFTGLAVDSTNAYFTLNVVPPPGGVYAVSLSGTQTPVPLYTGGTPTQIIQVGGALFWIDTSSQKIYGMRYP